jgi:hypothetical protein
LGSDIVKDVENAKETPAYRLQRLISIAQLSMAIRASRSLTSGILIRSRGWEAEMLRDISGFQQAHPSLLSEEGFADTTMLDPTISAFEVRLLNAIRSMRDRKAGVLLVIHIALLVFFIGIVGMTADMFRVQLRDVMAQLSGVVLTLGATSFGGCLVQAMNLVQRPKLSTAQETVASVLTEGWPTIVSPLVIAMGLVFFFATGILDVKILSVNVSAVWSEGDGRAAAILGIFAALSGDRAARLITEAMKGGEHDSG